ncbi:hypothetical protein B5807_12051 [Epicoccum nigrum]|uniref:Uncharacterized protein n=1 Tax=Epicoccum nigrum TaxID=105696 RepID=A0A1Y2LHS5_EPING|nr:hypothetical protein B5807_12051 [Epicoccum nigrum]
MVPAALDVGVCPIRAANGFSDFPSRRSSDAQHGPIRGAQRARHRDGRRCVLRAAAAAAPAASNPRYGTSHVDSPARNRSMSRDAAGRCPFRSYRGWQHDSQPDSGKAAREIAALRGASRGFAHPRSAAAHQPPAYAVSTQLPCPVAFQTDEAEQNHICTTDGPASD